MGRTRSRNGQTMASGGRWAGRTRLRSANSSTGGRSSATKQRAGQRCEEPRKTGGRVLAWAVRRAEAEEPGGLGQQHTLRAALECKMEDWRGAEEANRAGRNPLLGSMVDVVRGFHSILCEKSKKMGRAKPWSEREHVHRCLPTCAPPRCPPSRPCHHQSIVPSCNNAKYHVSCMLSYFSSTTVHVYLLQPAITSSSLHYHPSLCLENMPNPTQTIDYRTVKYKPMPEIRVLAQIEELLTAVETNHGE